MNKSDRQIIIEAIRSIVNAKIQNFAMSGLTAKLPEQRVHCLDDGLERASWYYSGTDELFRVRTVYSAVRLYHEGRRAEAGALAREALELKTGKADREQPAINPE